MFQKGFSSSRTYPYPADRGTSSCVDLKFTSQPNLEMESGAHSSLHPSCHHQLIHVKLNLKIYCPPPYESEVWHYQKVNVDAIGKTIDSIE